MFDTNIFNKILDHKINISSISQMKCFVTHIQYDEIQNTSDKYRKAQLNIVFSLVSSQEIASESAVFGISKFGKSKFSDGVLHSKFLTSLNKRNKNKSNNQKDVLIAITALTNDLTLVTHDRDLYLTMTAFKGASCNIYQLCKEN